MTLVIGFHEPGTYRDMGLCVNLARGVPDPTGGLEASPMRTPARNVSDFLGGDHRRLETILSAVEGLVESGGFTEAALKFAEFARGLSRHIDMEEAVLFPAFEEKTGVANGPTPVMRAEHVEIRFLLGVLASALAVSDVPAFSAADRQLHEVLGAHNDKEERILYPLSDRLAGGERERANLVRKMQAVWVGSQS